MARETGAHGPSAASPAAAATRRGRGPAGTPARPPSRGPATGPTAQVWAWPGSCWFRCDVQRATGSHVIMSTEWGEAGKGQESHSVHKAMGPFIPWLGKSSSEKSHTGFQEHSWNDSFFASNNALLDPVRCPLGLERQVQAFLRLWQSSLCTVHLYSKGWNLLYGNKFVWILAFQNSCADCELRFCCATGGHACLVTKELPLSFMAFKFCA